MAKLKNALLSIMYPNKTMERFWRHRDRYAGAKNAVIRYYHYRCCRKVMDAGGSFLPMTVQIDGRLVLPHGLSGIFVSQGARIGKNCTVFQQVTIGSNTLSGGKGAGSPVIGDNVYIGAGAKIIGGVRVGDNVRVGANCVVVTDIPDNATVVPERARIITRDHARDNSFEQYGNDI